MITTNKSEYIPTLDGWRALAITGVLICHSSTAQSPKIHAILSLGAFGVHIFFAISGFLITSRLIDEFNRDGRISLSRFFIRRAFRILPPALTYMCVIALFQILGLVKIEATSWFGSMFFFKNFYFKDNSWYLTHFWSLSVEEQFYLVWPFILVFFSIRRGILLSLLLILLTQIFASHDSHFNYDFILAGCFLSFLIKSDNCKIYLSKISHTFFWILLSIFFIGGITNKIPLSKYWICWAFALNIVWTVINPSSFVGRFLELPLLKNIGKYSYSIYLWQQLFCVMGAENKIFNHIQELPWSIFLTILCAILSYQFIEKPFIKIGHRLTASNY